MNVELINFAARLDRAISQQDSAFNGMALELFGLQFKYNPAYRRLCEAKRLTPNNVRHWTEVPFVPTAAFKELELSCIPEERTAVFHSSGTTEQKPSRHFHCPQSLEVYEKSLWTAFERNVIDPHTNYDLIVLTPPARLAPHSSLVHMFETVRRQLAAPETVFAAELDGDGAWSIKFDTALAALCADDKPKLILGTAFSFVHLLDFLAGRDLHLELPAGSRAMETGGYKNRSRAMPKAELHSLVTDILSIPRENIICEYGMSELSSQAYDAGNSGRYLQFPSWTRAQIISPESGLEVNDGETGLIRIFDLANVFSAAAIQTEDLAIRRGDGFELMGRAELAEARGCSLMTV
jgi:Acyl-protein synthetase, LuxE